MYLNSDFNKKNVNCITLQTVSFPNWLITIWFPLPQKKKESSPKISLYLKHGVRKASASFYLFLCNVF